MALSSMSVPFFIQSNNISLLFKDNTHVGQINHSDVSFDWLPEITYDNPLKDENNGSFSLERTLSLLNNKIRVSFIDLRQVSLKASFVLNLISLFHKPSDLWRCF